MEVMSSRFDPIPGVSPPGPTPVGPYEFLVTERDTKPNKFDASDSIGRKVLEVEREMTEKGLPAEKRDMSDGRRVYRVALVYLFYFSHDTIGSFVGLKPNETRFQLTDPTLTTGYPINDWSPVW